MTLPAHIASRIDTRSSPHGCWLWTGARDAHGYGRVRVGERVDLVHRVVFRAFRGPIDAGLVLLHACDNPPCCNPEHLTPGTPRQNAEDRSRKGRSPRQRPKAPGAPPGRRYW